MSYSAVAVLGTEEGKEVVLAAVKQCGCALCIGECHSLEFVSEALKRDKEVVLEAVKQSGRALRHASKELQHDKEVYGRCQAEP